MQKRDLVFKGLHILAWLIFVGLCIETGGLVVNFVFSIFNPRMIQHLYQKLDLIDLFNRNQWAFLGVFSFVLFVSFLKAYLFYMIVMLMYRVDLAKPFNNYVSEKITQVSYCTLAIGIISYVARQTVNSLQHYGYELSNLDQFWVDSQAFILMAAVMYVFATIFRKGVELQTENDLTV